jgi:hypothetical protein
MKPLYKKTVVIWSAFDPTHTELDDLILGGDCFISKDQVEEVTDPRNDPDWDEEVTQALGLSEKADTD